jgi:hypothetical protein
MEQEATNPVGPLRNDRTITDEHIGGRVSRLMFRRVIGRAAGAGLMFGLASIACAAGIDPVPSAPSAEAVERDMHHTIAARRLLLLDAELAPLNLGVRVRNRVATLWGPVPTADLGFKAEARLRTLLELIEVRNELIVIGDDPRLRIPGLPPPGAFLPPPPLPGLPNLPAYEAPPPLPRPGAAPASTPPPLDPVELPPLRLPQPKGM